MHAGTTSAPHRLRLFIAGGTPRSHRAVRVVRRAVQRVLDGECELEVIDVYRSEKRARTECVIGVPLLVLDRPGPPKRLVGELEEEAVAELLTGGEASMAQVEPSASSS